MAGEHTIVVVATDDMVITSKKNSNVEKFKLDLKKHWEITDLREIGWYLGFAVKCNHQAHTISLNQQTYIEGISGRFGTTNAKGVSMPMELGLNLSDEKIPLPTMEKTKWLKLHMLKL